ncbi:MAG: transcriptional regulator [Clostridia bacterium]|jgi:DNA-binding transcriptional LysR family regulator|nr:transcriptional regulator [Clostridia bacterium]
MNIRQLKTFLTIAKVHSFTQAAQNLGYAQSTITTQIQLLEEELNVKLFERLGHSITLTTAGNCLLPFAEQTVKLMEEAKQAVQNLQELGGSLSIGVIESLCAWRLPRILREYRLQYPNVELSLKFIGTSDALTALKDNTIDMAFVLDRELNQSDLVTESSQPESFALLAAPEHPLAAYEKVYPEDLNGKALILTEKGCGYRQIFETMMAEFGIKPYSIIETGNVQTIKQLVISGMGVTLLPVVAVGQECSDRKLVKLNWMGPVFELQTQVIRHKDKWISPPLKAFIQLLHDMKF